MRSFDHKRLAFAVVWGTAVIFGATFAASAQGNSQWAHEKNRIRKEQKAQEKAEKRGYRLYRGGQYYETDQRGVDLIRRAVDFGYQQGYRSGANDRRYGRGDNYRDESNYRSGNYGYQNFVDPDQYRYYFREGFQRGFTDGYNSQSQYGSYSGGTRSILGSVLNRILNLRSF